MRIKPPLLIWKPQPTTLISGHLLFFFSIRLMISSILFSIDWKCPRINLVWFKPRVVILVYCVLLIVPFLQFELGEIQKNFYPNMKIHQIASTGPKLAFDCWSRWLIKILRLIVVVIYEDKTSVKNQQHLSVELPKKCTPHHPTSPNLQAFIFYYFSHLHLKMANHKQLNSWCHVHAILVVGPKKKNVKSGMG